MPTQIIAPLFPEGESAILTKPGKRCENAKGFGWHFVRVGVLLCVLFVIAGLADGIHGMDKDNNKATSRVVGGPCQYKVYRGYAVITSICKLERKQVGAGGASFDCYNVKFVFHSGETIKEPFARVGGKEFALSLKNGWYPGAKFLDKYGIREGEIFDCNLNVITRGTCTPVVFDFPAIDLSDYEADGD